MEDLCAIRKIIFLVQWPVTSYEEKAWKFEYLRSQGFEVLVFDLSPLLSLKSLSSTNILNRLEGEYIYKIDSYRKLSEMLERESSGSIFLDYIANHSNVTYKFEKIYRTLKSKNCNYIVVSSGAMPVMSYEKNVSGNIKKILTKIKKAFNIFLLTEFILCKIIIFFTKHKVVYPMPWRIFGGTGSEVMQLFVKNRNLDKNAIIPINSFDYDSYVYSLRSISYDGTPKDDFCVFLDEAITDHPDFDLLGIDYISKDEYFSSMNRFFDLIESMMGLKVVIAAHPRSSYELTPEVFGGRTILKGQTAALVVKSKLVVMHMSTSVSFAILANKPVTVVKTSGIANNFYLDKLVDNMATNIGTKSVNIDSDELSLNILSSKINDQKYENYLYKYIKSRNAQELPVWEIVVLEIKKCFGGNSGK